MKIVYLIPGCAVSGGITVICQHVNRLRSRGHDVYLVTETLESSIDWFPNQQVPVLKLDAYPDNVDILVATAWLTSFRIAKLPARRKYYFVQSDETRFHADDSVWQHLTTISYSFRYRYITEARWIQRWLAENFNQEASLVPNGLDADIFHECPPLAPRGARPRILLEGAIALPYKGMKEAFEAVAELDAEIWCVSSLGRPEPGWRCDRFFEQVPITEMKKIYSSCDILLKLSRVEGFFGPPMEMMACGGAVVVGRVTGYDEYIIDGFNALVVDPLDVKAATAAVNRLIEDKALYSKLAANGKSTAAKWTWESSVDLLEEFYSRSLSSKEDEFTTYATDINTSISQLYYLVKGEIHSNSLTLRLISNNNNAERLCSRLKNNPVFVLLANIAATIYKFIKYRKVKHGI